jgi:hypothetical protein
MKLLVTCITEHKPRERCKEVEILNLLNDVWKLLHCKKQTLKYSYI